MSEKKQSGQEPVVVNPNVNRGDFALGADKPSDQKPSASGFVIKKSQNKGDER